MPVLSAQPIGKDTITSSGTSQTIDFAAPDARGDLFWSIVVTGGDVWMKEAVTPTAAVGDDQLILDRERISFQAKDGCRLAVIDA